MRTAVTENDQQRLEAGELRPYRRSAYGWEEFDKATVSAAKEDCAMPTRFPGTDVVIVGVGAAGGVAALPLAESGLSVVGLEAGSRLTRKDFPPDELRNNMRVWAVHRTENAA
ncbi:MAG: hypothetical protein CM1200mP25_0360 [Acidobacteriota bacterium]|nr:MAG: hypothetical protein CM1200mP25_0360 [Acidobacteriota bacterium]